jgi:hypothetical protein
MPSEAQGTGLYDPAPVRPKKIWLDRGVRPYVALSTALLPSRQRSFFTKRLTIGRTWATHSRDCGIQTIEDRNRQKHV